MNAYLLAALLFIAGMVVFILQNDVMVSVKFITWQSTQVSLALVIIISAGAGALITFLLDTFRNFRKSQQLRKLSKANQKFEEEIKQLKAKQLGQEVPGAAVPPPAQGKSGPEQV